MEPVTRRIKDMRSQDIYFSKIEPSPFKRVFIMANDIRERIDLERKEYEEQRQERRSYNIAHRKQDNKLAKTGGDSQ